MCVHVRVKNAKVESSLKELISKEMNNDNDLNLHLHDQMSGWLRYRGSHKQALKSLRIHDQNTKKVTTISLS